jgi:histone H2A
MAGRRARSGPARKLSQSRSSRAGLQFPVGRISRLTRKLTRMRLGGSAPVYLAAVLEFLTAEVLELAGNASKDMKKKRITPRYIALAVKGDEELDGVFGNVTLSGGGVIPHIHKALVMSTKQAKEQQRRAVRQAHKVAEAAKKVASASNEMKPVMITSISYS